MYYFFEFEGFAGCTTNNLVSATEKSLVCFVKIMVRWYFAVLCVAYPIWDMGVHEVTHHP